MGNERPGTCWVRVRAWLVSPPGVGVLVAIGGMVLVLAYAALALVQILVLNPLAAVPSESLTEIWAKLVRENGDYDRPLTTKIAAIGPALAVLWLLISLIWLRRKPMTIAAGFLGLLVLGTPGYFIASFSPGMNLADTFGIDGADYSPWAWPLYAISLASLVGLVIITAMLARRGARERLAAPLATALRAAPLPGSESAPVQSRNDLGLASMIIGICSVVAARAFGIVPLVGLILGIIAVRHRPRRAAVTGIIINTVFLAATPFLTGMTGYIF